MPGWLKILLILFGVFVLVVVSLGVAGFYYVRSHGGELKAQAKQVTAEGEEFGRGKTVSACLDESLRRITATPGFMNQVRTQIFMQSCSSKAAPSPELCAGAPAADEVIATSRWAGEQCKKRGFAGVPACGQLYGVVTAGCQKTSK